MCQTFSIKPEDFVAKWEDFAYNSKPRCCGGVTAEHLQRFNDTLRAAAAASEIKPGPWQKAFLEKALDVAHSNLPMSEFRVRETSLFELRQLVNDAHACFLCLSAGAVRALLLRAQDRVACLSKFPRSTGNAAVGEAIINDLHRRTRARMDQLRVGVLQRLDMELLAMLLDEAAREEDLRPGSKPVPLDPQEVLAGHEIISSVSLGRSLDQARQGEIMVERTGRWPRQKVLPAEFQINNTTTQMLAPKELWYCFYTSVLKEASCLSLATEASDAVARGQFWSRCFLYYAVGAAIDTLDFLVRVLTNRRVPLAESDKTAIAAWRRAALNLREALPDLTQVCRDAEMNTALVTLTRARGLEDKLAALLDKSAAAH